MKPVGSRPNGVYWVGAFAMTAYRFETNFVNDGVGFRCVRPVNRG